jgi:hypothetical protein
MKRAFENRKARLSLKILFVEAGQMASVGGRLCPKRLDLGMLQFLGGIAQQVEGERLGVAAVGNQKAEQTIDALGGLALGAERAEPETRHGRIDLPGMGVSRVGDEDAHGQRRSIAAIAQGEDGIGREIRVVKEILFQRRRLLDSQDVGTQF